MSDPRDELLDVVDDDDRVVGQLRREEVYAQRLRHRTVMLVVRNSAGDVLVHRRTDGKLVAAGRHDMMVGGVVGAGEGYDDAARRELAEEVGVAGAAPEPLGAVRYDGRPDSPWPQWVRLYEVTWDGEIVPQESEISWWAWWPVPLLEERLADPAWAWCADSVVVWRHYLSIREDGQVGDAAEIGFRPLRRSDLGDLHEWLADPDVRRWWVVDNDLDELEREYGPRIDGVEPTEVFVIEIDGEPSGIVQRYRNAHDSEWDAQLVAAVPMLREFPTAGIDYLLGRADVRRRGVGTRFLRQFTAVVFDDLPDVGAVVVAVQQANVASWRALERAGYRRMWEGQLHSDDPSDAGPSYLLVRRRDELDRA